MKAMVLKTPSPIRQKPLTFTDVAVPEIHNKQILVKVSVCGACHTDLDEAEGRLVPSKSWIIPGHQIVGTVCKLGKNASKFKKGDRVGITWLYWSCGQCEFCRSDRENLCYKAQWTGKDANGGYAEYVAIDENYAYSVPDKFTDAQAAPLLCAGVIGYRTFRLADIKDRETIGLVGFGASAHIVIQIIKHQFPQNPVYVFTKTEKHADLARRLGAVWTGRSSDRPPVKLNKIMDFTPVGECVADALVNLERGGRLIINAIRKETPIGPLVYDEYLWLEKEVKSVANVTKADAVDFLPLAAEIPISPTVEEFDLKDANEVLGCIKDSKLKAAAVLRIS